MTFLSPAFLAGLALVAVPVLIHLLSKRRRRTLVLPTLKFLQRADSQTKQRRNLRDILLLLLRAAMVTALVIAFSRPAPPTASHRAIAGAEGARLVIVIDRSASMSFSEMGRRTLLDIAREEAVLLVRSVSAHTRVSVIAYDAYPEMACRDASPDDAEKSIAAIEQTWLGTNTVEALKAAMGIASPRKIILISDLARPSVQGLKEAGLSEIAGDLRVVDLSNPARWNRWIAGVRADASPEAEVYVRSTPGSEQTILRTSGMGPDEGIRVTAQHLSGGIIHVPRFASTGGFIGTIQLEPDGLAVDDQFHMVLAPPRRIRAGYVAGALGRIPAYLRAVRQGVDWREVTGVDDLREIDALVFADGPIPEQMEREIPSFIRGGGTLLTFGPAMEGMRPVAANTGSFFPVAAGGRVDREDGVRIASGGGDASSVTVPGRAPPGVHDLPFSTRGTPLAFSFLGVHPNPASRVLARFENDVPYLVDLPLDRGRSIFWNVSADASWGDVPLRSLFPILLTRILRGADAGSSAGALVGDEIVFRTALPDGHPVKATGPDGRVIDGETRGQTARFGPARRPGIYQFETESLAVNIDPAEGDIRPIPVGELMEQLGVAKLRVSSSGGDIAGLLDDAPRDPTGWWRYLIAVAVLLGIAELLIGRPLDIRVAAGTGPSMAGGRPAES